jgi:hypothetical protein
MFRFLVVPGLASGLLLILWIWALLDVIKTDSLLVRNMQKSTWVFLVLLVPTVGAIAWLLLGRPEHGSLVPGGQVKYEYNPYRSERRPLGVEDTREWSTFRAQPSRPEPVESDDSESLAARERKLLEREAELAKREEALREQEPDDPE